MSNSSSFLLHTRGNSFLDTFVTFRFASYRSGNWEQPESGNTLPFRPSFSLSLLNCYIYYFRSDSRLDGKERGAENSSKISF
jgi:hypothetical protein